MKVATVIVLLVIGAYIAKARPSNRNALKWLARTGYYDRSASDIDNMSDDELESEIQEPLKKMRNFYRLRGQGDVDSEVEDVMSQPRCGEPDMDDGVHPGASRRTSAASRSSSRSSRPRYSSRSSMFGGEDEGQFGFGRFKRWARLGNQKWQDMPVTVGFKNYHSSLSREEQEDVAMGCAKKWAEVSGLTFRLVRNQVANLYIEYAGIDGAWGTIGVALSPVPHNNPASSYVKMDSGEKWKPRQSSGISGAVSLEEGLCHEMGHALGLGHASDPNSIMYPTVGNRDHDTRLSNDDISGIQSIYGGPNGRTIEGGSEPTTKAPTTTQKTTTQKIITTTRAPSTTKRPINRPPAPSTTEQTISNNGDPCAAYQGSWKYYSCLRQQGGSGTRYFTYYSWGKR